MLTLNACERELQLNYMVHCMSNLQLSANFVAIALYSSMTSLFSIIAKLRVTCGIPLTPSTNFRTGTYYADDSTLRPSLHLRGNRVNSIKIPVILGKSPLHWHIEICPVFHDMVRILEALLNDPQFEDNWIRYVHFQECKTSVICTSPNVLI